MNRKLMLTCFLSKINVHTGDPYNATIHQKLQLTGVRGVIGIKTCNYLAKNTMLQGTCTMQLYTENFGLQGCDWV
jgi:diphthamide biosynthesis methyltransferase